MALILVPKISILAEKGNTKEGIINMIMVCNLR